MIMVRIFILYNHLTFLVQNLPMLYFFSSWGKKHLLKNVWLEHLTLVRMLAKLHGAERKETANGFGFHLSFMSSEAIHYWTLRDISWVNISLSGQHVGHEMNQNRNLSIGDFTVRVIKNESPSMFTRMRPKAIFKIQFKIFIQDSRSLLSLNSHLNNEILKATTVRCI